MAMTNYDYVKDVSLAGLKEKVNAAFGTGRFPIGALQFVHGGYVQVLSDSGDGTAYDFAMAVNFEELQAKVDTHLANGMFPFGPVLLGGGLIIQPLCDVESAGGGGGSVPIRLKGNPVVGQVLTAVIAPGFVNTGGNWTRDGTNISGATSLTYTLVSADDTKLVTYKSNSITFYVPPGLLITGDTGPVIITPGAPTSFAAGTATQTEQPLSWGAPATGTAPFTYQVSRRLGTSTGSYTNVGSPISGLSLTVTGLTANTAYDYQVVAINANGPGSAALINDASTAPVPAVGPGVPTNFSAGMATQTEQFLSWGAPATGTAPFTYQVSRRLGTSTGAYTNVGTPISGLSLTVTGLTAGTPYDYQVVAINSVTTGSPASIDDAMTEAVQPTDYRPIFFVAPAMIQDGDFATAMASGSRMGTSGSKVVSSFPVQTQPNTFGWVALPAAASAAGATFTDLVTGFPADWIAAAEAGDMEEGGQIPAQSNVLVTYLGQQYRLFRMQWLHASPSPKNWSIS